MTHAPPRPATPHATPGSAHPAVRAHARVRATPDGRGGTALPLLASDGPLALRRTRGAPPGCAALTLVGAMSAPLGGDSLRLDVDVADGAHLHFGTAAATLALPDRRRRTARYDVALTVGSDATLRWLPEPLISAHGSDLRQTLHAELAPTARLVLREQQVLGRHGEDPGHLTTRLSVTRAGTPLLDTELAYGPGAPGWDGGAVLASHRAAGALLVVDPAWEQRPPGPRMLGESAVLTPLAGPAVLVTALAADALAVRRTLEEAQRELCAGETGRRDLRW